MKTLSRTSNNINIATLWENFNLDKYEFSPDYQREGNVWSEVDKSYLIDTILKNFPMPPVFLHQHIDNDTGKTVYDIVDGKQRLLAIISFLKNEISIPEDFASDGFGDPRLEGMFFKDLDGEGFSEWKKSIWKYEITIEYIETDDVGVVNHIFDRLNRNGEPLTNQELRKAKYGNSYFYNVIADFSASPVFNKVVSYLQSNRLEHHEFISELFLLVSENKVIAGDRPSDIDNIYDRYSSFDNAELDSVSENFKGVERIFQSFNLEFDDYRLYGVSHIFGLWGLAWQLWEQDLVVDDIDIKLRTFYEIYKLKNGDNTIVEEYRVTMSSGTKGASRRRRRINALYSYIMNR
jgi:hypothetical protein